MHIITVQVNDTQGRPVPTANNEILFTIEGPGKIIGVGNGDPACHEPDVYLTGQWKRSLFNGLAQIIVQSTREAGDIKLTATSQGVESATVTIKTKTVQMLSESRNAAKSVTSYQQRSTPYCQNHCTSDSCLHINTFIADCSQIALRGGAFGRGINYPD